MAIRFAGSGGGTLLGTNGEDLLYGGGGRDIIRALDGDDAAYGDRGNDDLFGGGGSDYLRGQAGNDRLFGESGGDFLYGGSGVDEITGGTGADYMEGDAQGDFFLFRPIDGTEIDTIGDFVVGEDQLVLGGGLRVIQAATFRQDIDLDNELDTVLTLTNGARIVLLGVSERQDWSLAGNNVMTLSEYQALA